MIVETCGIRVTCRTRDAEWEALEPYLPKPAVRGWPRMYSVREIIDGVRYVRRYGIPWNALPKDLLPHRAVYDYYCMLVYEGDLKQINHMLLMRSSEEEGRAAIPSAAILDSQTVQTCPRASTATTASRARSGASGTSRSIPAVASSRRSLLPGTSPSGRLARRRPTRRASYAHGSRASSSMPPTMRAFVSMSKTSSAARSKSSSVLDGAKGFVLLPKRQKVGQTRGPGHLSASDD